MEIRGRQSDRIKAILQSLRQVGSVTVDGLCDHLKVSLATVRRDLQYLEDLGLLRRNHGGATMIEPLLYEPFMRDRSFQEQLGSFVEQKRRIAKAAADLVQPGEVIALTAGTTTTEVVRSLPLHSRNTIITNTVNVAMELSNRKDLDIYVTGGHLRGNWFSLVGPTAVQNMQNISVDTLFIGVNGLHAERGLTCLNADEAAINQTMVRQAKRKIVVADHSKFGVVATWLICRTLEVNLILTDLEAPLDRIASFEALGIEVRRV